jgi:hypothetical protein
MANSAAKKRKQNTARQNEKGKRAAARASGSPGPGKSARGKIQRKKKK